jgi:solute:Na+ symporter, SSS family
MNIIATTIFGLLFLGVTILGFSASRWRKGDLNELDEWGLGGRRFGTFVTWFLLGGDLYTAYAFIAVPAFVFGAGAAGMFAVPYSTIVYLFGFVVLPRLWKTAKRHGYVTAADFVEGRFGSRSLALAIAVTGVVSTLPYIALQLIGLQVVIGALGFPTTGVIGELPIVVAFLILALYTYKAGLRAPAMISIVKDILIYVTIAVAIVIIPARLGGFGQLFSAMPPARILLHAPDASSLQGYSAYASLAIGSVLACFLYPQSITAVFAANSGRTVRRNMAMMPAYTIVIGFIALLGMMALVSGVKDMPEYAPFFKAYGANFAVPALFLHFFPSWFVGIAFAAIGIGALVPAAIMSIAAANLYARNIHRPLFNPDVSPQRQTQIAKLTSLVIKAGAVVVVVALPLTYAIQLQLLAGVWIVQTLPAVIIGLYTRFFDHRALLSGWFTGVVSGTWMVASLNFASSLFSIKFFGVAVPAYAAIWALGLNLLAALGFSLLIRCVDKLRGRSPVRTPDDMMDAV